MIESREELHEYLKYEKDLNLGHISKKDRILYVLRSHPYAIDYSVVSETPVRQTWKQCSESRAAPKSCLFVHLGILAFASRPCRY